jgi:hypothetical protein
MQIPDQKIYNAAIAYSQGDEIEVRELLEDVFTEEGAQEILNILSWDLDTDCPSDDFLRTINAYIQEAVYDLINTDESHDDEY